MSDPRHILIVDDVEAARRFLCAVLDDGGYSCEAVGSAAEASEVIAAKKPCLVLLDIMMPGGNGILFFKKLRKDPAHKDIPVVFITGASCETGVDLMTGEAQPIEEYSEQFDRAVGGRISGHLKRIQPDGILEKPVDPEALLRLIEELV